MHNWRASESRYREKGLGNCLEGEKALCSLLAALRYGTRGIECLRHDGLRKWEMDGLRQLHLTARDIRGLLEKHGEGDTRRKARTWGLASWHVGHLLEISTPTIGRHESHLSTIWGPEVPHWISEAP